VIKSLTTLDIKTYYRLMCCDLNFVHVLCISVLIQQGNQATQADQTNQGNQGNQGEQQVRPPFQNNYMNEDYDEYFEDNVNCYDDKETEVFLTKEEHDQFMDASEIFLQDEEERLSVEKEDYETGLQNAIMQFQRQYNL
jgi:hypothetical protein